MRNRKHQKEIDKAIANLIKYADRGVWEDRQKEYFNSMFSDVATRLNVATDELVQQLEGHGYMTMIFGYLFENFATCQWDNENYSMIGDYIKRRGWRESPYARRYLNALDDSENQLWEVVSVKAGQYVDVRPFGATDKPLRVYEKSGSQNLKRWDCIAARVMNFDGTNSFGGSILPFSPDQAQEIPLMLDRACNKSIKILQELRSEEASCQWSDDEIKAMAESEIEEQLPDLLFSLWASFAYLSITKSMPTILNRDGDLFQWSKVKFPIEEKNMAAIKKRLNSTPYLDFNDVSKEWVWLACEVDKVPQQGTSILGHILLNKSNVELSVNSVKRAEEGKAYLNELLGELIGQPLTVFENLESLMEKHSQDESPGLESVEAPELVTSYLDQHYRQILDEPIPALDNKTPRECSRQSAQHQSLIQWLKGLENSTMKAPQMAHYDFRWMWEELGIDRPE